MNKMYNLFLDDLRTPLGAALYVNIPIYKKDNWVIVKDYVSFITTIIEKGLPNLISFDHDLGDFHVVDGEKVEKTGYDCAKWLVNYCIDNNVDFPTYYIHSFNSVGSKNIVSYIENFKKTRS